MHLPYTDNYPEVVAVAAGCVATTLGALLWARPLPRRVSNLLFTLGVAGAASLAFRSELVELVGRQLLPKPAAWLQLAATFTTLAMLWSKPRSLGALAAAGQFGLWCLGSWVTGSDGELMFAHLAWYGSLLGAHGLRATLPPFSSARAQRLSYPVQDTVIFLFALTLSAVVTAKAFEFLIYNGDEVAYTFQANVYAHFHAYARIPACASMFENYWVFRHDGRAFSQYTPGWPLFMAAFDRLRLVWLAGPVMGGILAVGIARLTRRLAAGLGGTYDESARIVALAGPIGAVLSMLGPSLLLNAASRFSHTMVAACFAWSVEAAAEVATPQLTRGRSVLFGLLLGSATALCLATRPADGGFLGIGVFLYFAQALVRRRLRLAAFFATCAGFAFFGGLTAIILRLQLGTWFATGYSLAPSIRPEARLVLAFPTPSDLKYGIPLATGSYCWWPIAPALAAVGLVRALGGRARGVSFMLAVSSLCLVGFYSFVEFGRGTDDGLGPRYVLPIVVAQGAGTGAALAPLVARSLAALRTLTLASRRQLRRLGPALLALASAAYGVVAIAPRTYPVAAAEYHDSTGPLRAAREHHLKNAILFIHPEDAVQGWWNLNQNPPLDPHPDVLYLARLKPEDDMCAMHSFPGRKWYRAHADGKLIRLSAGP